MVQLTPLLLLVQIQIPPPRGYVNDFAGVLDPAAVTGMEGVIADVREKTRGEIVVVTLADIGDRAASDVALQIGRDWKVGPGAPAGDPAHNLGVIVLLVPRKDHRPGTGSFFIAPGKGGGVGEGEGGGGGGREIGGFGAGGGFSGGGAGERF